MFEDLKNSFDFFVRSKTRFSRKNFVEKNPELIERNRLENLYTEELLNRFFSNLDKNGVSLLDIGCKNWFYAKGEFNFLKKRYAKFTMDGVELDAYRLYSNFYSRYEVAKFYTKDLLNTKYIAGDLLDLDDKYDYIVWFLPFVFAEPLVYWGLPLRHFCPKKLLVHAYSLLNVGGQMLIVNQCEDEMEEQKKLLNELNIPFEYKGEVQSKYFEYRNKRYAFVVRKSYK